MDSSIPPPDEESYTKMDSGDVDAIGAHCQHPYCRQLDFLPFRCESCKWTFCLDHRSETAHNCRRAGEWASNRRRNSVGMSTGHIGSTIPGLSPMKCSQPKCKTVINTARNLGSRCNDCNHQYCLKHRFREEHECKNIAALGARQSSNNHNTQATSLEAQAAKVRQSFSRLRNWSKEKQQSLNPTIPKPSSQATQQVANLANLKKTAKGDANLAPANRIYLHVEAEAATTTSRLPKAELFFNSEWSVGRMLDDAAKRLQVANVNNRVEKEDERLRVYHVEGGRLLEFGEKLTRALASGNTVVLLRGVGDPGLLPESTDEA